jgi:hypothetical protein
MANMTRNVEMNQEKQVEAFLALLSKCLGVCSDDEMLVIYDESMDQFLEGFERAIESKSVSTTLLYLPKAQQRFLVSHSKSRGSPDKIDLPSGVVAAITASTVIVNLLDGAPDNSPVRKAVNHTPRPNKCRLATIPGISSAILQAILDAPVSDILCACEEIAWLLGEATEAEIITFDSLGTKYDLKLSLGGWENEPIMSPGILLPGSWGNVPPGETFCCPPFKTVNGRICINGSVRGCVLENGQEVVLDFVDGKLVRWHAPAQQLQSPALAFFEQHKSRSASNHDDNWNTFAELGIGLNPRITELTGNPLFDEKAIQTLHIAIGDNSVFGDDVSSFIHEDLVTRQPSLLLNGRLLMDRGVIDRAYIRTLRETACESTNEMGVSDSVIYLREGRIGKHKGSFMRRLSKAQRVNYVSMASKEMVGPLAELCDVLRADRVHIAAFLKNYPTFAGIPTARLLALLCHYRVLQVTPLARTRADQNAVS